MAWAFAAAGQAPAPGAGAPQDALERAADLRRDGRWPEALSAFRTLWAAGPTGPDKTAALAYGRMALLAGDAAAAVDPLRETADARGPLATFGKLLLAEALIETHRPEEASAVLQGVLASPEISVRTRALGLLARSEEDRGRLTRAADVWARLSKVKSPMADRDRAAFERARLLERAQRPAAAGPLYLALYKKPSSPYGRQAGLALGRMSAAGLYRPPSLAPSQSLDLARRFLGAGRREDAWDLLERLPAKTFEGASGEEASLLRVSVLYALRRNAECAAAADAMAAARGRTQATQRAAMKAAWALLRTGDHDAVAARCGAVLAAAGEKDEALKVEALHCEGTSAYAAGRWSEAAAAFDALAPLDGAASTKAAALYKKAWALWASGRVAEAREAFASLSASYPGAGYDRLCRYWMAEADLRLGRTAPAASGFDALMRTAPGYWSWAARLRLSDMGRAVAEAPPPPLPAPWSGEDGIAEAALARSLDAAGLANDAVAAFLPVYRKHRGEPWAAVTLAALYGRANNPWAAGRLLEQVSPAWASACDAPETVLEALFPAPQLGRVRPAAEAEGVPLPLVLGVVLQESGFDEDALSPAGAQGLMQVMPETAEKLRRPGEEGGDLLDPGHNASLGIRYLGRLLAEFPTAPAVAAYNAGEDVVARWLAAFGPEDERQFVAMIPYFETRDYAARVLWNARQYGRLLAARGRRMGEGGIQEVRKLGGEEMRKNLPLR